MGYDVNVINDDYHKWFSIWNWHRCMALCLYGIDAIEEEEFERQLMFTNSLQYRNVPPEEYDDTNVKITIDAVESKKTVETRIVQVEFDYDKSGCRVIGGRVIVPTSMRNIDDLDKEKVYSMIRLQCETNHMLIENAKTIGITDLEVKKLTSMDGDKTHMGICLILWLSCLIGTLKCSKVKKVDLKMMELVDQAILDIVPIVGEEVLSSLKEDIALAQKHTPSFELDELWSNEDGDLYSMAQFMGVMAQAATIGTGIVLT